MESKDWLWILHPALAVALIYPLIGLVARLGLQTRKRREGGAKLPPTTGREHSDLGRWLALGVVAIVLLALTVTIATKAHPAPFAGGAPRAGQLLLVLAGTIAALVALWHATTKAARLAFALITWLGVLALGAQPEVFRRGDNPLSPEFWSSHYWSGVAVVGLMLFSLGARPEILREPRWRRVHVGASVLAAVLFAGQAISGSRDLLEIPLHWQKPALAACDWETKTCPAPPAVAPPAPEGPLAPAAPVP
ncbi:MAG: DUF4079 domain-containing protein [Cyanobacteriota bacterium]|nr:DUF4079 domain-containing protein [Cyanobacteriota bacterium]